MARSFRLVRTQVVPRPLAEVFGFFSDATNLERITPAFLRFRILTPRPVPMHAGALIDYRLSLLGIPFRWRSRIDLWDPGRRFVDVQVRGPYRRWHHLHGFRAVPGGTEVTDIVDYEMPLGPLGTLARALIVGRSLDRIFDHRRAVVGELLGAPPVVGQGGTRESVARPGGG